MQNKGRFTLDIKMYIFVVATVLFSVASVSALAFIINTRQIDNYYKGLTEDIALTYSSYVDAEYVKELRAAVESEEYQKLREESEETEDDSIVVEYLEEKGLWERYEKQREDMILFQQSMDDVKYLYLVALDDENAEYDMYLLDADDVPVSQTGYYEEREAEFEGMDIEHYTVPVISDGDWGWLCSAYAPVKDENGNVVCHVGCDIGMEDVMRDRRSNLTYMILSALLCTAIMLAGAIIFVKSAFVAPLNRITREMKKFTPAVNKTYEEAGVIDLDIHSNDEIQDIYDEIHSMQTKIMDYIGDITEIKREKEIAEDDIRTKDEELGKMSIEAYRDPLTGIGNKAAYLKKFEEVNEEIEKGFTEFAVVMNDVNFLKLINDDYGHSAGDLYLKGCCHIICNVFKHSPVYRIGGDEFVAILIGEDYRDRQSRMEALRAEFEKTYQNTEAEPFQRYSASCGMAEYESGDHTIEAVFKRADQKMYEEKNLFKQKNDKFYRNQDERI